MSGTIVFLWPLAFTLLPLPLLVWWLLPVYRESRDSLQVPFFDKMAELSGETPSRKAVRLRRSKRQKVTVGLTWLLLVTALARPEYVGEPIVRTKSGRDLMVAVDMSGSMLARDFAGDDGELTDRLTAVKSVLGEFVKSRENDRLGLIFFADGAYLQAPFTLDRDAWKQLLDEGEIGMAGQSTRIGDAIGLAIRLFREAEAEERVLLLLTDGNDTRSSVPPVEAARIARAEGVRIHPVAMGDPASTGQEAMDMETLGKIADITGGHAFQAINREELDNIHQQIMALEPVDFETLSFQPRESLHHWPIGLAIVLSGLIHLSHLLVRLVARRKEAEAVS